MQVQKIDNSQSFKALNIKGVSDSDKEKFIKKGYNELKKLGYEYDIKLTTCYTDIPGYSSIDIEVKPLKEKMNFIKRFLRPSAKGSFTTVYKYIDEPIKTYNDLINSVKDTIKDLNKKVNLHK